MSDDPSEVRFVIRVRRDVDALPGRSGSLEDERGERYYFSRLADLCSLVRERVAAANNSRPSE